MKLFNNEQELPTNINVKLTSHRVSVSSKEWWGDSYTIYLFLEDISSVQILFKSSIALLLLGCGSFLVGFMLSSQRGAYGPSPAPLFIIGIVFLAIWWFSKRHIISITPDGGKALEIMIKNVSSNDIDKFLFDLQEAKFRRINELNKEPQVL